MSYQDTSAPYHFNREKIQNLGSIEKPYSDEMGKQLFHSMEPFSYHVIEGGGIPVGCTYWLTAVRTEKLLYVYNREVMVRISEVFIGQTNEPTEEDWKELFLAIGSDKYDMSHYMYLELVIGYFWKLVFKKSLQDMWCAGIITSHGDKCYGHESEWAEHGISFKRGSLLFLLSYTSEFGETPKHMKAVWVIENYPRYLPLIEEAEKLAGL